MVGDHLGSFRVSDISEVRRSHALVQKGYGDDEYMSNEGAIHLHTFLGFSLRAFDGVGDVLLDEGVCGTLGKVAKPPSTRSGRPEKTAGDEGSGILSAPAP